MSVVSLSLQDRLAIVSIDNPPVNALSHAVRAGIVSALDEAADAGASAAVLHCEGRTFVAGADIREFGKPPQSPWLPEVIARIEAFEGPVVAALHGTALGGGLELALGCHYRIAVPSARVGFPEVNLGLIPGAGGTQRTPRLIGAERALDMMISGKPVNATVAAQAGIVDRLVENGDLFDAAIAYARELVSLGDRPRRIRDLSVEPVDDDFFNEYRQRIARRTRGLMSPDRIVRCVEAAIEMPIDEALAQERAYFSECMASPQSGALRHLFFAERQAAKPPPGVSVADSGQAIARVAVIGAGTMGAGIAYSCLGAGYQVTVLDNDETGLARGRSTIEALYEGGVKRGRVSKAARADGLGRLTTARSYDAVADADLVI